MCGIVAVFDIKNSIKLREQVLEMSRKIRHRGPDWTGVYNSKKAILSHERLSIVDHRSGKKPLYSKNKDLVLKKNLNYFLPFKLILISDRSTNFLL